ncbi:zinc finger protein 385D isoform X2 [Esox lucius]|uniref:C2H2-type domain-containing protein n=1 Tax=Esox lucius TaxID=8010 RepID=A0A3P8YB51_ESOLU|nr:zinc finger protein 385D isoform X2 [Esox lucius]
MESSMFFGNACQNGLLPTLLRPAMPSLQPSLGMKQFQLPFPLDTASAVSLFPGFGTVDPVQKAVMHHTFGVPPSTKRRHVSCNMCQLRFNSQSQALAHYKGTKHAKKLKSLDAPKCKLKGSVATKETIKQETPGINTPAISNYTDRKDGFPDAAPLAPSTVLTLAPTLGSLSSTLTPMTSMLPPQALVLASKLASSLNSSTGTETTSATGDGRASPKPSATSEPDMEEEQEAETDPETEEEKARRLLYCSLCKVAVNSASQLEAHNSGTKHKTMLEARSGVGSIKAFPRPGVKSKLAPPTKAATGLQDKTFHCEICNVHVNSETQLKQHISSRRHKDRAAGKPAKPKYSPYSKTQKVQAKQPLTVGKELCQPQMTHIIPAHLAALASAAAAMGSALPGLGPNHAPGPTLFHPLLRPAPGPIRTSHTQLLFAPY